MFLSATTRSLQNSLFHADADGMNRNLGGAIETCAHSDVQALTARMALRDASQAVCLLQRCRKCESGRSPRALSNSESAFAIERSEHGGDVGTCESHSTLRDREIVAKARLKLLDRRSKAHNVVFGGRGQCFHDDQPAELGSVAIRERWQAAESRNFVGAVDPPTCRIEYHNNSPAIREADMADDWGRSLVLQAAAVDNESASVKQPDTDTRARAAAEVDRIPFNIERQVM